MRQFTISRLLIAFLMMLCCGTAMASDFVTVDGFKFLVDTDKDEATLLANDYSGEMVVPEKVAWKGVDYPVVAFSDQCFYNSGVSAVKIPGTVVKLGEGCFEKSRIQSIEIPSSVTTLGKDCFSQCGYLYNVILPNSIAEIPYGCFWYCSSLASIKIPSSVTSIGSYAFAYSHGLKNIELSEGIISLKLGCFSDCTNLKTLKLPKSLEELGNDVFDGSTNLKEIRCDALNPPSIGSRQDGFSRQDCILSVPQASIEFYKQNSWWGGFGIINTIEGDNEDEKPCSVPAITYTLGNLSFESSTPGAEYHYTIKDADVATDKYNTGGKVQLNGKLDISVYATADGYKASDKATATLYWLNAEGGDDTNNINLVKTRGVMVTTDSDITISGLNDGEVVTFYSVNGVNLGSAKAVQGVLHFARPNESIVIAKIKGNDLKITIR